ncbi:MAG: hypothetical protein H7A32_00815 [Deltaproteobacteria bacterium]|nr:hypothetical protein [Deltaproteobacteria bacterium]
MSSSRPKIVICRTCVRDNPKKAPFTNFEENAKYYQSLLKEGFFKKSADLHYQNCFAVCENFHCVLVHHGHRGFLFKKISSVEKIHSLVAWVRKLEQGVVPEIPEDLQENLLKEVKEIETYKKF